ncbi:MAG TPA: YihY/virulence factor BrkB family protein [Solirubrobacterales bacterium]|jgi:membrane protein|nr:YihY/virulence factor BrkB family protein [Solirubrobacterales bacterium]
MADPGTTGRSGTTDRDDEPTQRRGSDFVPRGVERRTGLWPTLKRTATEFQEDNLTDWAAALTYYGLLALFPALIALVSIVGLVANPQSTTNTLTDIVTRIGPDSAASTFEGPIRQVTESRATAGFTLIVSTLVALWSASGYLGAFIRASNAIYETREGRPFWKLRPLQLLLTLVIVVLLAVMAVGIVLTGPIVSDVAEPIGISGTAVSVWGYAKWIVVAALFLLMIALIYYASPNVKQRGFRWITPGGLVALVAWLLASAGFGVYVSQFGSYNKVYGSLAGVVVILIWLWITNLAILFGHELNAERERDEQLREGVPGAEKELQLEPRDRPKRRQTV